MATTIKTSLLLSLLFSVASSFMVNFHGNVKFRRLAKRGHKIAANERPLDPTLLLGDVEQRAQELADWCSSRKNILVLTGAGLSTESGIPDYRGSNGAYHAGHKPMVHDQFMNHSAQRQRYWGRGLVGWKSFAERQPNEGHVALAKLQAANKIGVVRFQDSAEYHASEADYLFGSGQNQVSIITQNVDELHQRASSKHVTELHGRTSRLQCMNCGSTFPREGFTLELEQLNKDWVEEHTMQQESSQLRPDGDAQVTADYSVIKVPPCTSCGGFLKPRVVFFGDNVPKHRVERCKAAVRACDGLLCIGTSLAVHSAFRFVKLAASLDTSVCVLNVGETRAEAEGYDVMKVEAPIGPTLTALVQELML